jgi:hypothetical protein
LDQNEDRAAVSIPSASRKALIVNYPGEFPIFQISFRMLLQAMLQFLAAKLDDDPNGVRLHI